MIDWREWLAQRLIAAGTNGLKQRDLVYPLRDQVEAGEITEHLEVLKELGKVQKFKMKTKGRPATIWRATTLILED